MIARDYAALDRAVGRFRASRLIRESCFGPQRAFVEDTRRFRAAVCGRRAGKSRGVAAYLLVGALVSPGTVQLYLGITRKSAKRIIWTIIDRMNREYELGFIPKLGDLIWEHPGNGSEIHVAGCPDASAVDTFRGTPYRRFAIDEAASFPPSFMGRLVDEALIPSTADYRGEGVLVGSPGVAPVGYLWEASTGKMDGWGMHHWTMLDNPHMPDPNGEIEALCARRGWPRTHATIQREYLGRWVADQSMLVYGSYSDTLLGTGPRLEDGPWHYVLGLDFGSSEDRESMAYALLCYSDRVPIAWVVETAGEMGATPASVAARVSAYGARYKLDAIVGDPGSLGADFIKELRERYRIPIEPAEKANKRGYIELLNGDMKSGLLRFVEGSTSGVVGEMKILPWGDDSRTKEKEKVPNHHCDATLYGWRRCRQYDADVTIEAPDERPPSREDQIVKAMISERRRRRPWHMS